MCDLNDIWKSCFLAGKRVAPEDYKKALASAIVLLALTNGVVGTWIPVSTDPVHGTSENRFKNRAIRIQRGQCSEVTVGEMAYMLGRLASEGITTFSYELRDYVN
jgi:hypothetical protein